MSTKKTVVTQGTQAQQGTQSGTQSGTNSSTQSGTQSGTNSSGFTGDSSSQTQNQFDWLTNPGSADIDALRGYKEQVDPSIGYNYARQKEDLRNSFNNPLGAYTTPATRDAALRSSEGQLEQSYGQAQRNAYSDAQQRTGSRLAGLAQLTAPRLTQTGSTSKDTSSGSSTGSYTGSQSGTQSGESSGASSGAYSGTGSNNGQTTQSDPLLPQLIGAAASVGGAAM